MRIGYPSIKVHHRENRRQGEQTEMTIAVEHIIGIHDYPVRSNGLPDRDNYSHHAAISTSGGFLFVVEESCEEVLEKVSRS